MTSVSCSYIDCKVPDGETGIWRIKTIKEFKVLFRKDRVVMSSAPVDVNDIIENLKDFKGSVLLTGLGLGIAVNVLLDKAEVTDITVLEKEIDVINLVAPSFKNTKVKIIHADAFTWIPPKGKIYDFVWHDIFNFKHEIKRDEIERLNEKYAGIAKHCGLRSDHYLLFLCLELSVAIS